jgi:hypothetical protein
MRGCRRRLPGAEQGRSRRAGPGRQALRAGLIRRRRSIGATRPGRRASRRGSRSSTSRLNPASVVGSGRAARRFRPTSMSAIPGLRRRAQATAAARSDASFSGAPSAAGGGLARCALQPARLHRRRTLSSCLHTGTRDQRRMVRARSALRPHTRPARSDRLERTRLRIRRRDRPRPAQLQALSPHAPARSRTWIYRLGGGRLIHWTTRAQPGSAAGLPRKATGARRSDRPRIRPPAARAHRPPAGG